MEWSSAASVWEPPIVKWGDSTWWISQYLLVPQTWSGTGGEFELGTKYYCSIRYLVSWCALWYYRYYFLIQSLLLLLKCLLYVYLRKVIGTFSVPSTFVVEIWESDKIKWPYCFCYRKTELRLFSLIEFTGILDVIRAQRLLSESGGLGCSIDVISCSNHVNLCCFYVSFGHTVCFTPRARTRFSLGIIWIIALFVGFSELNLKYVFFCQWTATGGELVFI